MSTFPLSRALSRRAVLAGFATAPFAGLVLTRPALAASDPVYNEAGIAWDGHDPVAYFTKGAPTPGNEAFSAEYQGARVLFSSAETRDMFVASPETYAPQFGGYCAYAASKGYLAPTVPEAWTVFEDKLYLNFSLRARELWLQDVPGNVAKGNANWPGILDG
ncbi:YHS domain protein [Aliiroseovarius crassostreae]|uniref:YHS domain-containing (seleno)protein n=1 Tax=Aliiroseovarius crassostreae TaxID=154981 RepID=UPI00220ABAF7|nr:YHS domain-containing (seleno)protein [Aliiroseovarius crassostreae]UWP88196.1 YHS domain protein [Aliiroseovarius crassostreae]UWP91348.1 YHS domain protein [Aliiroseovarius crassostreae]UWQ00813.1 YHS domain protein [Aliiroseovarius crassostreae]UWQ10220.1 YHS domain protein [Aliiroseovarius crassostreae]